MPNRDERIAGWMVFWFILTVICLMGVQRCVTPPSADPVIRATKVRDTKMIYRGGEFYYLATVEFDDAEGIHNSVMIQLDQREWQLFVIGQELPCLYPYGRRWRLDRCR